MDRAYLEFTAELHNIHVHNDVIIVKLDLVLHVVEKTADLGSKMDNVVGLVLLKTRARGFTIARP